MQLWRHRRENNRQYDIDNCLEKIPTSVHAKLLLKFSFYKEQDYRWRQNLKCKMNLKECLKKYLGNSFLRIQLRWRISISPHFYIIRNKICLDYYHSKTRDRINIAWIMGILTPKLSSLQASWNKRLLLIWSWYPVRLIIWIFLAQRIISFKGNLSLIFYEFNLAQDDLILVHKPLTSSKNGVIIRFFFRTNNNYTHARTT